MEVEEENTSNHLQGSATTVINKSLLDNDSSNGNELGKEVSESHTPEEKGEESSVIIPKLDDPNHFVVVVEKTAEVIQRGNSESDGCWNSAVVESTNVFKGEEDEGGVMEELPTGDMAAVERDGSNLIKSGKVDGGECEAAVTVLHNDLVEENVKLSGEDINTDGLLVIGNDKDGGEGEMETMKVEDDGKVLKDSVVDVQVSPVAKIGEIEEVMTDVKNDGGVDFQKENVEIVQGDEIITEGQDDVQGVDAEVVNEEKIVADGEEALGVEEGVKEEGKMADEEKSVGVTENDEEKPMGEAEEKSLDTELESDEEATMADEEKVPSVEAMETELPESSSKNSRGKRKRGKKNSKPTSKSMAGRVKMIEEDVCFICFDGGDLVLCDHRNCPKAYHPSCVNRDEAFFQTKGRWNCGWHLCSICEKKAEYMCYTCSFSLCKSCIKIKSILCVREKEKKGFCEACMKTVMLIEKISQENKGGVDFDDKNSWEYLFKDYWIDTKGRLDLSVDELVEAMNARKGSELSSKQEPPAQQSDLGDDGGSGSENPSENLETRKNKGRKRKKRKSATGTAAAALEKTEWASKELLEFVTHMGDGDKSYKSQFDVQALLLEYIKTNNLRDSRHKTHINCDARLERLFGKPRVGHFEMLKLLESHFLVKEDSQTDDIQGSVVDDDEANEFVAKGGKDRKRKTRKKGDREPQSNREDYAAIDNHNINVIYMRRKLVEDLLDDIETFPSKITGTFVRIRISGANQKHDIHRLVQVTGINKRAQYSLGKKTTDIMLEVLNLDKTESVSIDTISNQDFTEDECRRLRQSIKCGLINRLTVGDILDKAMELQAARVNDWLETEIMRLSHLRDRASDLGRKKELRECVEKLQVLKTPEERARRLEEFPVIHADPTMDPNYGSEDDTDEEDKKQDLYKSSVGSRFSRREDYSSKAFRSGTGTGTSRTPGKNYELNRSLSNNNKVEDATTSARLEQHNENQLDQGILKKANDDVASPIDVSKTAAKVNEMEKMWHYKDPHGKIQGPFSMTQLRKWSNNKFFPADLRIWRKSEKEDNGVLLTDALEGRFRLENSALNRATTSPDERHGFANLPSPTPNHGTAGLGQVGAHMGPKGLQSPTPNSSQLATSTKDFSVAVAPQILEQQNSLQSSPSDHLVTQMVQPVAGQSLPVGPSGWSGGPSQNPLPSPLSNVAAQQQLAYNQWGSVQNTGGKFLPQHPAPVNLQQPPPQSNVSWQTVPGNQSMNWPPTVQGVGNAHPGWVPPPPAQPYQGWVAVSGPTQGPINSNWAGTHGNQIPPSNPVEVALAGNQGPSITSTGWVGGPGNQGAPTHKGPGPGNTDMGWGLPTAPGNLNQGWGSPTPRNRATWDGSEHEYNKSGRQGGGSGYHGSRRQ